MVSGRICLYPQGVVLWGEGEAAVDRISCLKYFNLGGIETSSVAS